MAFGFASAGGNSGAGGSMNSGPDLETVATEDLGFLAIAGDAKLRLTTSWSPLPGSTSSLLSIASRKGLVAAAGPDQITIATTESVRKGFEGPKDGDSDIRSFNPQLKLPMPMRVSQLAFTADEKYLILSAESGGGLAVYEVQSLLSGSSNSAFELPTNGESLRALALNPTPEKAELCAIVTANGNLHMANLKERRISDPLKSQVSCVSWSSKGKQLCAGLADGTIHQMTPEGDGKADIPKAPSMDNHHVSSLTWLENNLWLAIYTANGDSPTSTYNIITRQPPSSFTFQKISDPIEPFVVEKVPHHSLLRLRDYPPDLQDLLIVSSTASSDIGLLSRSQKPLATDKPAASITGVFTMTELLDDSARPTLPMTDAMDDSTPIGLALDLSSKDKVYRPISSDEELEESPNPLPGLWVLTHEGILCSWWLIYKESIKQGKPYPGLSVVDGSASTQAPAAPVASSPFATAGKSMFGSTPTAPALASPSPAAPAFGSSAQLGQKSSPWGAPSATSQSQAQGATFGSSSFGNAPPPSTPSFGKPSALGFGQASQIGMRTSPWGAGGSSGPAFGQSSFSSFANKAGSSSPFGAATQASSQSTGAASSGGFAGFASQGGFASLSNTNAGGSVFGGGNQASLSPFASSKTTSDTSFPPKPESKPSSGLFSTEPFKLSSSFKPDPSAQGDSDKPSGTAESSLFGNNFGSALDDAKNKPALTQSSNDDEMDTGATAEQASYVKEQSLFDAQQSTESTTPTTTPAPSKFLNAVSPAPGSSVFGQPTPGPRSTGGLFGSQPQATPSSGFSGFFSKAKETKSQDQNTEPETPKAKLPEPEAPLPPDTTSRIAYPVGDSSSSSAASNPPISTKTAAPASLKATDSSLPPDLLATPKPKNDEDPNATRNSVSDTPESTTGIDAPLPPDFVNISRREANKQVAEDAPLPPDPPRQSRAAVPDAPLPSDHSQSKTATKSSSTPFFSLPKPLSKEPSSIPSLPAEDETDLGEDDLSEGSGVDVAKDLSPSTHGLTPTPGFTPQSSFGGLGSTTPATVQTGQGQRQLFGELSRNAPVFPRAEAPSPRSPSPIRGAIPNRVFRQDTRSVSAPGMASQILGSVKPNLHPRGSIVAQGSRGDVEDPFIAQHRRQKARQEMEETQPLIDEEDDEIQKMLSSEVEGTLALHEFIAHTNSAQPAKESVPSQVEAVYRDINSMIDTVGLNSRSVKAFVKGHSEPTSGVMKTKDDLEDADSWVLCEVDVLGNVVDTEVHEDLEMGRVQGLEDKLKACKDLAKDLQRVRAKQEDLKKIIMARMDPDQAQATQSQPLSAEQAAQQNELRKEFAKFSKLLAEAEESLILLKAKLASASGSSGKRSTNVPTVEAVIRTITKMTTMVEKRSGDIDVLENQMRKMQVGSTSREGSPMVTPQARRSIMFSPDSTPSRNLRNSFAASVGSLGSPARGTPTRKKLSGFSQEEKGGLMDRRARRQAVLANLEVQVEKKEVQVWNMDVME